MKIKITETLIEATAEDLKHSNSLAQNFAAVLNRCFVNTAYKDDETEEEEEMEG